MMATDFARNKFSTGLGVNEVIAFPFDRCFGMVLLSHTPLVTARLLTRIIHGAKSDEQASPVAANRFVP
jgi:hypothetical protein